MDCAAVKPRMEALVSGSLPEAERAMAEQHIAMCEGCRLELELVRATGSQEKPASGSKEDWTIDRIFGGGGEAPAAAAPAPAPEPESPPERPHPALAPPSEDPEPETAPRGRKPVEATWSFEPADHSGDHKPPEESLFFAAEALERARDTGAKKSSNARVALWSIGGVIGLGLLGFAGWFAMQLGSTGTHGSASSPNPAPTMEAPETSTPTEIVPPPQPEGGTIQDESGEPMDNSAQTAPAPAPAKATPRVSASIAAPQPMPLPSRAATTAPAKTTAGGKTTPKPSPTASTPTVMGPTVTTKRPWAPRNSIIEESTADQDDDMTPTDDPVEPEHAAPKAAPQPTRSTGASTGTGSPMWSSNNPRPAEPAVEAPAPAPTEMTPIERLHLATVAARERGDQVELRRLRTTWKAMIPKIVGPDRARAKREYADCLWGIQDLSGRRSDQKDALGAYREYLLSAPAGGADSRSVSRLRQLEDALAEPH